MGTEFYNISEQYFNKAIEIKNNNDLIRETIEDWIFLSKIYAFQKKYVLTENSSIQGLSIARTYELAKEEGIFYQNLGNLYRELKNYSEMINYYQMAIENFMDFDDESNLLKIYEILGEFYQAENKNLEKSLNLYYKILIIHRNQDNLKEIAHTLTEIANIHIDLTDNDSAIECLEEAESIFKSLFDNYNSKLVQSKIQSIKEFVSNNY